MDRIVQITDKSYGNDRLAATIRPKINDPPLTIMQNGLNIAQPYIDSGFPQISRCLLSATSQELPENSFMFRTAADAPVGLVKDSLEKLVSIVGQLTSPYFGFTAGSKETNTNSMLVNRTVLSCGFFP